MTYYILPIKFKHVLPVWEEHLWPDRKDITDRSAMSYLRGINMANMDLPLFCYGAFAGTELIGVNTGHLCSDSSFRSRGLWVNESHRGNGLGVSLLKATIDKGAELNSPFVWSYPRKTSWPTYEKAGFKLTSKFRKSQTSGANAYCYIEIYNEEEIRDGNEKGN